MVIIKSVGMVIFFRVFKSVFTWEDLKVAGTVSLALRITERCTPYLTGAEKIAKVCDYQHYHGGIQMFVR